MYIYIAKKVLKKKHNFPAYNFVRSQIEKNKEI